MRALIAAGGTAGHVLPSLAVAAALSDRGVSVTFAGSPDRVEARLVPEAGYELDTFEISGFPRRPSAALLRSLIRAGRAPRACAAILKRRRPHVVLGGGGYVAGPMVYAAWRQKLPAALTEADAHLGLANRLAAPFARRVFLAYGIPGRDGSKYRVTGRPVPADHRGVSKEEGRRRFGLPAKAPVIAFFGALAGARSLNDFAVDTYGDAGPAVLHISGRARLRAPARAGAPGATTCSSRRPTSSAPPSPHPISRSRGPAAPSGSSPPRARPRSSSRTRMRPPITRR